MVAKSSKGGAVGAFRRKVGHCLAVEPDRGELERVHHREFRCSGAPVNAEHATGVVEENALERPGPNGMVVC